MTQSRDHNSQFYSDSVYLCSQKHTHRHNDQRHMLGKRKQGNVVFNDTLNTFYLGLYVKDDHLDRERKTDAVTTRDTISN